MKKMNKIKLFIAAGAFFLAITNVFAANNEKGIEYFRAELYDAAKIFFLQQTNQSAPEQAENYYYLGQTYHQLNQEDSASYYYQKSIEALPEYPFGYIGQGRVELQKGNTKAAEELFKKATGFAKKDPSVQTAIAEVYVDAGDYGNAIITLDKARKINIKYPGIYLVEGDMLMKQGQVGPACGKYDNAILFDKTSKVAYLKSAQVYKDINPTAALNYLNQLIALDPNYIPAYALIGDINREAGRYQDALNAYEKFISIQGVPLLQHERYAQLLYFTEQYPKAMEHIKFVLSKAPDNMVMKRLEAYCNFQMENYSLGLEQMNRFLTTTPKERHIYLDYFMHGHLAVKVKQHKMAIESFRKALELDSTKTELYKEMGNAAFLSGNYPEAASYYEKYLKLDDNAQAGDYFIYGQACFSVASDYITNPDAVMDEVAFKNYVQKGDSAFAEVVRRFPTKPHGYLWRANINTLLDKFEDSKTGKIGGYAKPFFEEVIPILQNNNANGENNKDIISAYKYLVSYYQTLDDTNSMIDFCKKILNIDPNDDMARKVLTSLKVKY